MREIKFRAWDKENQRLYEVVGISYEDNGDVLAWRKPYENENVNWCTYGLKVGEEAELIQYTGSKDINGREIYEGDLYKYTISHDMYNPESGHTTFEIERVKAVTFENGAFYHGNDLLADVIEHDDSFTYVGNIYENPELLEGDSIENQ
ncbi:YopX family protein [Lysinibacillus telephonicus]|uniref:YopX family protein n=1 Tax=Lysinibacillus telephonicus TaxID=1714840 RepID=UPI003BA136AE